MVTAIPDCEVHNTVSPLLRRWFQGGLDYWLRRDAGCEIWKVGGRNQNQDTEPATQDEDRDEEVERSLIE